MTSTIPTLPSADSVRRRAGSENFSVASLVLGPRTRRHLLAVYGFARLVDEVGDHAPGDRLAALDEVELELDRAFGGTAQTELFQALTSTLRDLGLRREPFARLIEANRRDQVEHDYETWGDLVAYCDLSANPVGELVLAVFGAGTPNRVRLSDDVCTALQLIEHVQDVREDALQGRVYMPLEDREAFGVDEVELTGEAATPAIRSLVAFECARADELLRSGDELVASLRRRARLAVAGYVGGGRAQLAAVSAAGYEVLASTPAATGAAKARATLRVLCRTV